MAPRNTLESVERLQNIFNVYTPMAFAGYGASDYNGVGTSSSRARAGIGVFTFDGIQDQQ
jgi:hypothetical protein